MYKKFFTSTLLITCAAFTLCAQDIIVKENGDEIEAKVLEITPTEVKYRRFDNLSGPVYTVPKSELFMIKYENGTREVIEREATPVQPQQPQQPVSTEPRPTYTPPPVQQSYTPATPFSETLPSKDSKKSSFGWSVGMGTTLKFLKDSIFTFDLGGFYWRLNINPHIGWTVIQVRTKVGQNLLPLQDRRGRDTTIQSGVMYISPPAISDLYINQQFLTGICFRTGYIGKHSNREYLYASFKAGAGVVGGDIRGNGFCYEFEFGIAGIQTPLVAINYNHQGGAGDYDSSKKAGYEKLSLGTFSIMLGWSW